ncbi:MAG: energy transducer TonB [Alphaproteobacteria bacterium]|nr:MAG: energy transducer TonB [Alphaproteobacteria bacterium]
MRASRLVLGVPLAAAITFGLFFFMRGLISSDEDIEIEYVQIDSIEIYKVREDTDPEKETDDPNERIEQPPEIERPDNTWDPTTSDDDPIPLDFTPIDDGGLVDLASPGSCGVPIVRVPPNYPESAARKGIEGWVAVRFTVNEYGQVSDVHVSESEPPGIFDKAAVNAVKKWKYNPCKGAGTTKIYLEVVLNFELE